jgi:RNA polymerase sigma-70 factor (ECF subfamily)
MDEAGLIARAAGGDARAIRELYDRYEALVFTAVRRIAGDDDLACDCAQEAWVRAIRGLSSFRAESRFSTWLHRIAVNTAIQSDRQTTRRARRDSEYSEIEIAALNGDGPIAGEPRADALLERRLENAMARLPEGMRRVLVLHDVEEYTHEEIGELLGVTAGTSKSQLFKARARMREILGGDTVPHETEGVEAWNT